MQRTVALRAAGAFASCVVVRNDFRKADIEQRIQAEETAKKFNMDSMVGHPRSAHDYAPSSKGAEVGARNEAAFMDYQEFKPRTLSQIFVMPGDVNLLTISPLYCFLLCLASAGWGIFYWDLYCRKNYETVLIARPQSLRAE